MGLVPGLLETGFSMIMAARIGQRALKKVVSGMPSEVCGSRQSPGSSAGACEERQVMNNGAPQRVISPSPRPVEQGDPGHCGEAGGSDAFPRLCRQRA